MEKYLVKFGDKVFEASKYQSAIFDNIKYGVGNMIINAAAGSSKTTTIINCLQLIPETEKVLFMAFNTNIVDNITNKIGNRENVDVRTFHSLGNALLMEYFEGHDIHVSLNEYKYKNYIKNNINILTNNNRESLGKNYNTYIRNIINLTEYCRYYMAMTEREIAQIASKYDVSIYDDEIKVCREVLIWGKEYLDEIDYTDMIWLPNILNLTTKIYKYDRIFIDEGQDTSVAEQLMVEKTFKRGARLTVVGDTHQQINIWCGASEEAIDHFRQLPNTKEFKLPITYRCPKKIVDIAKEFSDNIIADKNAIDGEIYHDVSKFAPNNGDMVLCRTTAPLIKLHLLYNKVNKKSFIRGFDNVRETYLRLINDTNSTIIDKNCLTENGLFSQLYEKLIKEIEKVQRDLNIDYEDALEHPSVFSIFDSIEGISAISDGLTTVEELKDKINTVFNGTEEDAIQLSTVHKAKGLEADNVYILRPSLMPLSFAKKDWEVKTEMNLIYVAITRAKKTLNYIKEEQNDYVKSKGIKTKVEEYKLKHNIQSPVLQVKNKTISINKPTPKLGETNKNTSTSPNKKGGNKLMALKKRGL